MGIFSAIGRLFAKLSRRRHDYRPGSERFQQIDTARIAADLGLAAAGAERGRQNDPPTSATTFDDVEQRVITSIEAERNHCHDRVIRDLAVYDDRLAGFAFLSRLDEVKSGAQAATAQFLTLRLQGQGEIHSAEQRVKEARSELMRFRDSHRLRHRSAVYPDSLLLRWGVVGLIVLVESAVNGVIFAASNSFGLIGGVVYALVLSALNIALGLMFGRWFAPQLNHRSLGRKLIGLLSIPAYFVLLVGLNLVAAHYRDLSRSAEALQIDTVLIPHILATPFALREFSSWLLFVLGIVFSLVAAVDGHSMDDAYPGYGAITRRAREAVDEFNEGYATLLEHAESIRSTAATGMTAVIDSAEIEMATYRTLIDGRQKLIAAYKDYVAYLEQCAQSLLAVYRTANRKARSTDAPETFSRQWKIAQLEGDLREIPNSLRLDAVDGQIREAVEELRQLRTDLTTDHKQTIEQFASLRSLIDKADSDGQADRK